MKPRGFLLFCLFSCSLYPFWGFTQPENEDPLLPILQKELETQFGKYKKNVPPAYYMSFRVEEREEHRLTASMGSPTLPENRRERVFTVQIRIGNPVVDNYHPLPDDTCGCFTHTEKVCLPLDDNRTAISKIIDWATKDAYIQAFTRYGKVMAALSANAVEDRQADDFEPLPGIDYYEPRLPAAELNLPEWQEKLNDCTKAFDGEETITEGEATLQYLIVRKYFVNSEGSTIVENHPYTYFCMTAEGQADDGMRLPLRKSRFYSHPDELPATEELADEANDMKMLLYDLKNAPVAEPFSGPAVFSGEAACIFFQTVAGNLLEPRNFKNQNDRQTLKDLTGKQIMPKNFTVAFDPTADICEDQALSGSYRYDDEGVAGKKTVAVKNGILQDFLSSRSPADGLFFKSNGHGRAEAARQPEPRQSNLIVTVDNPLTDSALRKLLINEAKSQGKDYGYWVQSAENGQLSTGRDLPNGFIIKPTAVYRIYTDGRPDEPVRGISLAGTPLTALSQIAAGGNVTVCHAEPRLLQNGFVPSHCCAPAVLVKHIEAQRQYANHSLPPLLPYPITDSLLHFENFSDLVFKAMQDEIKENMNSLQLENLPPPYYISHLITDGQIAGVKSSLGSIISSEEIPVCDYETRVLVGNDLLNNDNFDDGNTFSISLKPKLPLPLDNNYQNVCRALRKSADDEYKKAAVLYSSKKNAIKLSEQYGETKRIYDRSEAAARSYMNERCFAAVQLHDLEDIANELSYGFAKHENLTRSGVDIYVCQTNAYFAASDKMRYAQPFSFVCVHIYAEAEADDGEPVIDCTNLFYKDMEQLPPADSLMKYVHSMAAAMEECRNAAKITENYTGPVLMTGEAAAQVFAHAFLESACPIVASRKPLCLDTEPCLHCKSCLPDNNPLAQYIDQKVIDENLTVSAMDRLKEFDGLALTGSYETDAEGVSVDESANYIENGVLLSLLSNRTPTEKIPYSNGHERLALTENRITTSRGTGVLSLSATKTTDENTLKKELIKQAKKSGCRCAYIIRKTTDRNMRGFPYGKTCSDEDRCLPAAIYEVDLKNGTETRVRGADMEDFTTFTFKRLSAVSEKKIAYNTLSKAQKKTFGSRILPFSGIPTSLIVPEALLFDHIHIRPAEK